MGMVFSLLLLVLGFVLLVKGADRFVDGASDIAGRLGISQLVIGLTIVAMGTSAPEAAVSKTARYHHWKHPGEQHSEYPDYFGAFLRCGSAGGLRAHVVP